MSRRTWVRLDNASNIFLAATSAVDSKVFRLSAELTEDVEADLLQRALDRVFDQYVLYHSVLRRGVFWYYLEDSDLRPSVVRDVLPPGEHIYHFDRRELLFRVIHHRNRIALEVFHALSDGVGAMRFFQDLVCEYVALRHPQDFPEHRAPSGVKQPLVGDSFRAYFVAAPEQPFELAARSAPLEAGDRTGLMPETPRERAALSGGHTSHPHRRVHRVHGTRTPDNRTRTVELEMSTAAVLPLARELGVSLTAYFTALFLESVRSVAAHPDRDATMAVSVPVDLRQHFPSESARNFFAVTRLEHTFGATRSGGATDPGDAFAALARSLHDQLRTHTTPAALEAKLAKLIGFELNPAIRVTPRPLKDFVLGTINRLNNRSITVAISNLGRVTFPHPVDEHVGAVFLQVSAARPQFCTISHGDRLTLTFTSPFVETGHQREFVRTLTARGVAVRVAVSKVTVEELGVVHP